MNGTVSRASALALLEEWTKGESLRKHGLAVSVCTESYGRKEAERLGLSGAEAEEFVDLYACAGLLHDMDYERHPSLEEHPFVGVAALREGRVGGGSGRAAVSGPDGGWAEAAVDLDEAGRPVAVDVEVDGGEPLAPAIVRSYVVGAAHMGLGWVCSEAIAVDEAGSPEDLTIRSFGVLRARDTPPVTVRIRPAEGPPRNCSDAAFAAVAAATWIAQGLPDAWPTRRGAFR